MIYIVVGNFTDFDDYISDNEIILWRTKKDSSSNNNPKFEAYCEIGAIIPFWRASKDSSRRGIVAKGRVIEKPQKGLNINKEYLHMLNNEDDKQINHVLIRIEEIRIDVTNGMVREIDLLKSGINIFKGQYSGMFHPINDDFNTDELLKIWSYGFDHDYDININIEGRRYLQYHNKIERNPYLKEQYLRKYFLKNDILCELCNEMFTKYDLEKHDVFELHHCIPLFLYETPRETIISDLILICPNCHRLIHKNKIFLSKNELIEKWDDIIIK